MYSSKEPLRVQKKMERDSENEAQMSIKELIVRSLASAAKEAAQSYVLSSGPPQRARRKSGCTPCEAAKKAAQHKERISAGRRMQGLR